MFVQWEVKETTCHRQTKAHWLFVVVIWQRSARTRATQTKWHLLCPFSWWCVLDTNLSIEWHSDHCISLWNRWLVNASIFLSGDLPKTNRNMLRFLCTRPINKSKQCQVCARTFATLKSNGQCTWHRIASDDWISDKTRFCNGIIIFYWLQRCCGHTMPTCICLRSNHWNFKLPIRETNNREFHFANENQINIENTDPANGNGNAPKRFGHRTRRTRQIERGTLNCAPAALQRMFMITAIIHFQ